ncbi:ferrochelatase [Enterococcus villorum]|uniref:Ferrochelatase n=2 Tax=Enterococcus villorum TaxID=112904 RepID=A0A511J2E5_9ENTE|nr:hypothetical protein UAO_00895 [Enterococcus villorum ATCC 700913]EOW76940.1 hypothetical protein I591_02248 [Enterococcus villorum ATCC 700913]GEL91863.1 ferrochelatase [Enterococcus villorum]
MPKNRLEAFTDAVIAIIMTILVLELHKPEADTWQALTALGYRFLIYIVSFFTLGIYWNNHHHMFQVVRKVNGRVIWANSFFIFALSLFPFATSWISEYSHSLVPEITYGVVTLGANIAYYLLARELVHSDPTNKKKYKRVVRELSKILLVDWFKCLRDRFRIFDYSASCVDYQWGDFVGLANTKS